MSTQKIKQIIEEIEELRIEATHKSALRIYNLLENNKKLFEDVIDKNNFKFLLSDFEEVSYKNPSDFNTPRAIEQFNKLCENLLFHCSRIV